MTLLDQVRNALTRLAPHGWRKLMMAVTHGSLDISASDLLAQLTQKLERIDRSIPGFQDFAEEGTRAISAGSPAFSLLYHAFAHPAVVHDGNGKPLTAFPTLAEIDVLENYVFGVQPAPIGKLHARGHGDTPLA